MRRLSLADHRGYLLINRLPADHRGPSPLVIVLHSWRGTAAGVQADSGWTSYAASQGAYVAYGVGVGNAWNAGTCCGNNKTDDVGYLTNLLRDAEARLPIDPRRVYVTGLSNGAMLALAAVCRRPDLFAAAGLMSGTLTTFCVPAAGIRVRPIRVIQFNGAKDSTVPPSGGYSGYTHSWFPSVNQEGLALPAGSTFSQTTVPGLGHKWATYKNSSVDATAQMWDFFKNSTLQNSQPVSLESAH